jgi:hypothetical protein
MYLKEIAKYELKRMPLKYTVEETNILRDKLNKKGYDLESFFQEITKGDFFVSSSRIPLEEDLQVRYSNYSFQGKKYLHYMKIPYYAFITALHDKLDFSRHIDYEKAKEYKNIFDNEDEFREYIRRFSPNPNSSYSTNPEMPRKVTFESCFIPEIMNISLEEYSKIIKEKGMLKTGYIYIVENQGMVPSHRYPDMEFHCFKDIPFLARIPISRELDWKYPTNIRIQQINLSELHNKRSNIL